MDIASAGLSSSLSSQISSSSAQLSSGKQINSAADSPASIQLISQFSSQINGESAAYNNVMDGVGALQIAEGGLSHVTDSLQQIRELALQSANGTLNSSDKSAIQSQAEQLLAGIQDSLENSNFNGTSLLDSDQNISLQTGSQSDQQQDLPSFDLNSMFANAGLFDIDFTSDSLEDTLSSIDEAFEIANSVSGTFGAALNVLDSTAANLSNSIVNQSSSLSQIQDTDYASAITEQTQQLLARDVEISMLGQANADRAQVLQLLNIPV